MSAAVHDVVPPFESDAVAYFWSAYRDVSLPAELRLVAAVWGELRASHAQPRARASRRRRPSTALEDLVRRALESTPEQRLARAESIIEQFCSLAPPPEIDARPEPEPDWAATQRKIKQLHRQIAELEAARVSPTR